MDQQEQEEWRPVPSLPGVMVSSWGRVHRVVGAAGALGRTGRPSKPTYGNKYIFSRTIGDDYVALWIVYHNLNGEKRCRRLVSRLVAEVFLGPAPDGKPIVMHMDDDPTNNRPDNLRWGSHKDNLSQAGSRAKVKAAWVRRRALMVEQKALLAA